MILLQHNKKRREPGEKCHARSADMLLFFSGGLQSVVCLTFFEIYGNGPTSSVDVSVGVHSHACSSAAFTNFPMQDYLRVPSVLCCMEEQDLMC